MSCWGACRHKRLEQEENVGSQVFMAETCLSRQTKFPSAVVASNNTCGRQYKLPLQRGSTAVLDCSGSECSRLPCTSILRFSLLLSSPDYCPYSLLSRLLILILQHVWLFYYLLAECNCLQFSRLKGWSSFETVMEHPQVETGPEHSRWHRAFNLLNISGLMAIQHDWWLPASCCCYGWKGCLPLEDRKLS